MTISTRGDGRIFARSRSPFLWCAYHLRGKEYRECTGTADPAKAAKFLKRRLKELGRPDRRGSVRRAAAGAHEGFPAFGSTGRRLQTARHGQPAVCGSIVGRILITMRRLCDWTTVFR
jgi:hypothetical protein